MIYSPFFFCIERPSGRAVVKRVIPTYGVVYIGSDEIVCGLAPSLISPLVNWTFLSATRNVHGHAASQTCKRNLRNIAIGVALAAVLERKGKGVLDRGTFAFITTSVKTKGAETQAKTGAGRRAGFVAALRDLLIRALREEQEPGHCTGT